MSAGTIMEHFSDLPDPRTHILKNRHIFLEIIVIAVCAVICGADDWVAISDFGRAKHRWFSSFLELPHGIPSHDTFDRIFSMIDPNEFQRCFVAWMQAVARISEGEIVPIDGKTLRRSHDSTSNKAAIHMVSAWATGSRLVLEQVKTEEKSNEITAIPELLKILDIHGCIVTTDAMGCQKKIAGQIIEQEADYVLGLKGNQGALLDAVEETFAGATQEELSGPDFDVHQTEEDGHGRHEVRTYFTTSLLDRIPNAEEWEGLQTLGAVLSEVSAKGKTTTEYRYYIASIENNAQLFAHAVRSHWGIENSCHWVLDVAFREDESRVRKGHGPENFALLRHIALNLIREEKTAKVGVKNKRLRAGWDNRYLAKVVFG
jgi:predicted transposase YbfD/YdcC